MLRPKRKIPWVTTAGLVLGGTATGCYDSYAPGEGGGSGSGSGDADLVDRICRNFRECEPEYFSDYYDSLAECRRELGETLEYYLDYYRSAYGEDCIDAIYDYYDCLYDIYEDSCMAYAYEECRSEYAAFADACYGG